MLRRRSAGERYAGCVFVVAVKRHMKSPSASDVLRSVCAWADGMNEPLRLRPLAVQGGLDQQQLVAWYERHGFARDGSGTGMVRYSNAALSLSALNTQGEHLLRHLFYAHVTIAFS